MNLSEKKELIKNIKNIVSSRSNSIGIQFTYVELEGPFLKVSHNAGAHDKTMKIIDDRLVEMGLPTTNELKEYFDVVLESGDPASSYTLKVRMKAVDRNRIKHLRGRKMANIPNSIKY